MTTLAALYGEEAVVGYVVALDAYGSAGSTAAVAAVPSVGNVAGVR